MTVPPPAPRRALVAALLTLSTAAGSKRANAQSTAPDLPSQSVGRATAQIASGLALAPIGYVGGGLATRFIVRRFGGTEGDASGAANKGAYVGVAVATAAGPALIGARGPGRGYYLAALGGATVGMFGTALVARLNRTPDDAPLPPCRLKCRVSAVAAFLLPSVGATLGYNLSRHR